MHGKGSKVKLCMWLWYVYRTECLRVNEAMKPDANVTDKIEKGVNGNEVSKTDVYMLDQSHFEFEFCLDPEVGNLSSALKYNWIESRCMYYVILPHKLCLLLWLQHFHILYMTGRTVW